MPKVSKLYLDNKRESIVTAALNVCKRKPLYEIIMSDIIKESGVSQGGIYRYYSDVDEILIDVINGCSPNADYTKSINSILQTNSAPDETITRLMSFMGKYMSETETTLGKFQFELTVMLANQPDRAKRILTNLKDDQSGKYFLNNLFKVIREGVSSEYFLPVLPVQDILQLIKTAIDGIVLDGVLYKCYGLPQNELTGFDSKKMMNTLAKTIFLLLNKQEALVNE